MTNYTEHFENLRALMNEGNYNSQIWAKNQFRKLSKESRQEFIDFLIDLESWDIIDLLAQSDEVRGSSPSLVSNIHYLYFGGIMEHKEIKDGWLCVTTGKKVKFVYTDHARKGFYNSCEFCNKKETNASLLNKLINKRKRN